MEPQGRGKKEGKRLETLPLFNPTASLQSIDERDAPKATKISVGTDASPSREGNYASRVTTHCACSRGNQIGCMADGARDIRLARMEQDSATGRIRLSWLAQQEDGSWRPETTTLGPEEGHPLLEICRRAAEDFARRERGATPDS